MSVSSLLLKGKKKQIDTELDALFTAKPTDQPLRQPQPVAADKPKRKLALAEATPERPAPERKPKKRRTEEIPAVSPAQVDSEISDAGSEDSDSPKLLHESIAGSKQKSSKRAPQPPPEDDNRDARTIFIGNLSVDVVKKRPLLKQLRRLVFSHCPENAKIESSRFRSVAFKVPTSKLPTEDEAASGKAPSTPKPSTSQHSRDRAQTWSSRDAADDLSKDEKKFLTPQQKKKVAFIQQQFHEEADTTNCYIVFAHSAHSDPYEAARIAAEKCNGIQFLGRVLRVDVVSKEGPKDLDTKLCIFVGNLDFASKEDDLRVYFEGIVAKERGPSSDEGGKWVTKVRVIRDKETQLGKGFAYVQFADKECVDEIVSMEVGSLRFAKRKLRVQRCKNTSAKSAPKQTEAPPSTPRPTREPIPRMDPALGEKLAHLSKEDRKIAKTENLERVQRRLAKKKARGKLDAKPRKERTRERKSGPEISRKAAIPTKRPAARVRSEKSNLKRNMKK